MNEKHESYWILAQNGDKLPKPWQSGLHLVDAIVFHKTVGLRRPGAFRSKYVPRARWDMLFKTPNTGQTFGEALDQLRGSSHVFGDTECPLPAGPRSPEKGQGH